MRPHRNRAAPRDFLLLFGVITLVLGGLLTPLTARALETFVPPMPSDPEKVEISLLTVGRGPQAHALFGHTILRVVDPLSNMDVGFNWGMFDFSSPLFFWRFYTGDMRYQLAVIDTPTLLDDYRLAEKRRVVEEPLNLTTNQKVALMRRLIWNAQPENLFYQYHQLHDNCSTRLRDHLDHVLGGKIKEHYGERLAPDTFRYWMNFGSRSLWWAFLSLDIMTNDLLDRPITDWQKMFLPENLRRALREMPAYGDDGRIIPGRSLLGESSVLVDYSEPPNGQDPYFAIAILLSAPMIAGAIFVRRRVAEGIRARILGSLAVVYGTWSGFWGTILFTNWILSGYAEGKHNGSLWLFWPLDWIFVVYGVRLLKNGFRPAAAKYEEYLALAHLISLGMGTFLWLSGLMRQDVMPILASMGTMVLVFSWMFRRVASRGGGSQGA